VRDTRSGDESIATGESTSAKLETYLCTVDDGEIKREKKKKGQKRKKEQKQEE
jgi:hypothetical protein